MTPVEAIIWERLRKNRLNDLHFRHQQIMDGFIVDFYSHAGSLIVEVDGEIHETQIEQDAGWNAHLISRGFQIFHFTLEDVEIRLLDVLNQISKACLHPSPYQGGGSEVIEEE